MNYHGGPADWERELLCGDPWYPRQRVAVATFTRTDGETVVFRDVRTESIGPSAENKGCVGVELHSGRLIHLPFIQSWEISYE